MPPPPSATGSNKEHGCVCVCVWALSTGACDRWCPLKAHQQPEDRGDVLQQGRGGVVLVDGARAGEELRASDEVVRW